MSSSNSSIVRVFKDSQIIPLETGTVDLTFSSPGNDYFVAAEPVTKSINIIDSNKSVWRMFRKNDVRYTEINDRFSERMLIQNSFLQNADTLKIFNEDYVDSDGDGFSNLFERAIGSDSLGPDRKHDLPFFPILADNRVRISFVRYVEQNGSTMKTAGEEFNYHVEHSNNLQTWSSTGVELEKTVYLGGGMERQTWVVSSLIPSFDKSFLRLRVTTP